VLEGTLRKAGDRLLHRTADLDRRWAALWSQRYDRTLRDVSRFRTKSRRRSSIRYARRCSPTCRARPAALHENIQAYGLYLKGRYCVEQAHPGEGVAEAISYFGAGHRGGSGYAPATRARGFLTRSTSINRLRFPRWTSVPARKEYAHKALQLDETFPRPMRRSPGALVYDWDWDGADENFAARSSSIRGTPARINVRLPAGFPRRA